MSAMTVAKVIRDIFGGIGFIFTALFMASVVTMFIIILPAVYLDSIGLNVSPTMNFLSPVLEFIINSINSMYIQFFGSFKNNWGFLSTNYYLNNY